MPPAEVVPFVPFRRRAAAPPHSTSDARSGADAQGRLDYEQFFLDNIVLIEAVVAQVCRRGRAGADEEEAFRASAHAVLVENDFTVLRVFTGRSSLRAFLTAVLQNAFRQHRASVWGRWRPSVEATRLGTAGVLLEQLTTRDRRTFDEAAEILWTRDGLRHSRDELWAMYLRLPARRHRWLEGEPAWMQVQEAGGSPQESLIAAERASRRAHARAVLARVLRELPPRERLIFKLQYVVQMTRSEIARRIGGEQKAFDRQCCQVLARVRRRLEEVGVEPVELGL